MTCIFIFFIFLHTAVLHSSKDVIYFDYFSELGKDWLAALVVQPHFVIPAPLSNKSCPAL